METMNFKEVESRFICSSAFENNFSKLNLGKGKRAILIFNAKQIHICVYGIENLEDEKVTELVNIVCDNISWGCSYRYKIIDRVDNVFFIN